MVALGQTYGRKYGGLKAFRKRWAPAASGWEISDLQKHEHPSPYVLSYQIWSLWVKPCMCG